jgi:hypothetical protein
MAALLRAVALAALAAGAASQCVAGATCVAGQTVSIPAAPTAPVPFTAGNIVVARLGLWNGTGWSSLATIGTGARAVPYYLDELKCVNVDGAGRNAYPGGLPCVTVQTIALPTTTVYGPGGVVTSYACTGNYDFVEGQMTLSEDGRFLVLSCYDTPPNFIELRQGNRVACIIGWDGSVDCSTAIPWGPNPGGALSSNYWSAYTPNGCDVYMAGNGGYLASGGIQYTYRGLQAKSWPILSASTSYNSVISVSSSGGQMYAMVGTGWSSSPPAMPRGVMAVGGKNPGSGAVFKVI